MKLLSNSIIFFCTLASLLAQNVNLDLKYEQAIKLTNADDALKIYDEIINSNQESDYVWLSKLKKAEMYYARGSYITSSSILKEFNLKAPIHLQSQSAKNLLYKSLNAAGESDSLKVYQKLLSSKKTKKNPAQTSKNNKIWFIQFGAFSSFDNAKVLKESLKEEKISDTRIDQVFKNGKMIYYVRSSHYESYDKVLNRSKKLKGKTKFTISGF
jgi:hypothetical protein|tara:strand:+ start:837 stop:1475 length:639 start_codon:yes stop_codon:yes gene_type:complete